MKFKVILMRPNLIIGAMTIFGGIIELELQKMKSNKNPKFSSSTLKWHLIILVMKIRFLKSNL